MHVKRQTIAKTWPIARKGTKYVVVASHDKKNGIPLLIVLREMMKLGENRKEIRRILLEGQAKVNGKIVRKDNISLLPYDILEVQGKKYELGYSDKGKFKIEETKNDFKLSKVIGKKILKGKKIQINLLFGQNVLSDKEIKIGSTVMIKEKKIQKVLPLEEGRTVAILSGKYLGKIGEIKEMSKDKAVVIYKDEKLNVPLKNILVIK